MAHLSTENAIKHAKRVYTGIKSDEQMIVADTYCDLLLLCVVPEGTDELIDTISMAQETAKIMMRVNNYNEDFKKLAKEACDCNDHACGSNCKCVG